MFTGIVVFEWHYHTRRSTFAAAAAFFALFGFMLAATGLRPGEVFVNAPYNVAHSIGLLSLVTVFVLTLFCAQSLLRDTEHRTAELIYTTSITKSQYLFGRFAGSFLTACTTFAFALLGLVLGTWLVGHDPAMLGPFDALDYLWHFVVLAVPNMLFAGALLFAVAALTGSPMATYVGGVFLYLLYFAASMFTDSPLIAQSAPPTPESLAAAALADPFGLSAFFEQTHYWTAAERNVRRLALEGHFLLNRLAWTGFSVAVLALVHRLFAFRTEAGRPNPLPVPPFSKGGLGGISPEKSPRPCSTAPAHAERWTATWRAFLSATRLEGRHVFGSWPFVALMVAWTGFCGIEIFEYFRSTEFRTALLPTTGLILGRIQEPLTFFGLLAIVYHSAELVWRERVAGIDEIVDATPASSAVFLAAKAATLGLLIGVLAVAVVSVAVVYQLASGFPAVEVGLYAAIFYFTALPLMLLAVLALFIQTITPNRYLGMLATVAAAIVLHRGAGGPDHPLLRYAAAPAVPYSEMSGFSPRAASFSAFMLYWTFFAVLLALVTYGLWRRGTDAALLPRLAALPRCWGRAARRAATACVLLFAATGAAVFYQTNVLNAYETSEEVNDFKADYERAYRRLEEVAQPTIVDVRADVDLYPRDRRYRVHGRYRLANRAAQPIDTVWVTARRDLARLELSLAGRPPSGLDERFRTYTFALDRPLGPGAEAELAFDLTVERRGATAGGGDHDVVENGSFLLSPFLFPTLGYRRSRELRDPDERRRRGLPEDSRPTTIEDARAAGLSPNPERITFESIVSTPADQIAVAPGVLVDSRQEDGRRYFHYRMEQPIRPYVAYVSARYAVRRVRHGGVDVEVYYHPRHGVNVPRFVEAAKRALDYCVGEYGPYPHRQLRLVEIPAYWDGFSGLAMPGVIYFVEDHGFLTDLAAAGRIDIVTKRVAHEVAHQWWGHQVVPAEEPGASTLVETLARYTELMVLKELYGEAALPQVLSVEHDRYLAGRTGGGEVPLYQVQGQSWLYYSKGAVVMMALHDLIGEAAVNRALRGVFAVAAPTSLDLLDQLYGVTPEEHHVLLDQWWKQVVLYDLSVESAAYEASDDGRFRVTVRIEAGKSAWRDGEEVVLAMDEAIDVAVFSRHPNTASGSEHVLHAARYRLGGSTELTLTVDERPSYVGVDPFLRRIDRNLVDNVGRVEEVM